MLVNGSRRFSNTFPSINNFRHSAAEVHNAENVGISWIEHGFELYRSPGMDHIQKLLKVL